MKGRIFAIESETITQERCRGLPVRGPTAKLRKVELKTYLEERRALVESRLDKLLPPEQRKPETLHRAMRYSVLAGGKRFRPILCLAAAEACGGMNEAVLDAACAIEMVHCFSLIHDDLPALDNDELRRGKPTVHVRFGEAAAILAGDALFALAFETLSKMAASDSIRVRTISALAAASGTDGMVGGQVVDMESQSGNQEVEWIHERKTGALIAAACEIGAIVSGADADDVAICKSIGKRIGLAFQIADDILDETADSATIGKTAGKDRRSEKATFPSVLGVEKSKEIAIRSVEEAERSLERFGNRAHGFRLLARYSVYRDS